MRAEIMVDEVKCAGCRACEMICSYHHNRGFFGPSVSGIQLCRMAENSEHEYAIRFE